MRDAVTSGERPAIPDDVPPELAQLMRDCWDPKPAQRPDMASVVRRLEAIVERAERSQSLSSRALAFFGSMFGQRALIDLWSDSEGNGNAEGHRSDGRDDGNSLALEPLRMVRADAPATEAPSAADTGAGATGGAAMLSDADLWGTQVPVADASSPSRSAAASRGGSPAPPAESHHSSI